MLRLVLTFLALACAAPAWAHPLQAEPLQHPYVFTFDQFHLAEDPDESLLSGGLLLMAETRCLTCHAASTAWADQLAPRPGPDLRGIGSRLETDTLWLLVRSPQHTKKGTLMPGLFTGADGDAEKVEAIVTYLDSLREPIAPMPPGNRKRGRDLYHRVGCVACHQPAKDERPPGARAGEEVEQPGNASVPLAFADAYNIDALGRFLLDPQRTRPAGRMPSLHLTEQEAADIATYLHVDAQRGVALERQALNLAKSTPQAGKAAFIEQRCHACHSVGEPLPPATKATAIALLNVSSSTGCLAENAQSGVPRYDFSALQRRALQLALRHVQSHAPEQQSPEQRIDLQMLRLNCYACHDRDGKGGAEEPRLAWFREGQIDSPHAAKQVPPTLDSIEAKPDTLPDRLRGHFEPTRPRARMPDFGQSQVAPLLEALRQLAPSQR